MIKPLVSVCMITYNHEKFIEEAFLGVINQITNFEVEFIISSDCSTDNTEALITKLITNHSNKRIHVKYFNNLKNVGMTSNFVFTLNECKGRYIALCEGDDYWTDSLKLQKQVDFLEANTNYSFCWTRFKTYNQIDKTFALDFNSRYFKNDENFIDFDFETSSKGWHIGTQTLLFRNAALSLSKCKHFEYFRDVHVITQLLKVNKGACLNFVSAVYRIHDAGIHSGKTTFRRLEIAYLANKEIYLDYKSNPFLKKKYLQSYSNYLNVNINEGNLKKALLMSIDLFFKNGDFVNFLRYLKRIVVKKYEL